MPPYLSQRLQSVNADPEKKLCAPPCPIVLANECLIQYSRIVSLASVVRKPPTRLPSSTPSKCASS
jgi:hypothetical protein